MKIERPDAPLIPPYGDRLVDFFVSNEEAEDLGRRVNSLPAIQLTERALCDLELLATGAFSPLDRFVGEADYQRILDEMRLTSGYIFPIPVALSADPDSHLREGNEVALCNARNEALAVMQIEEIYEWN